MTSDKKPSVWNIPNILTMMRIGAIPILVVFLLPCWSNNPLVQSRAAGFWAAALFSVASITDWLDGYLARRMGIQTVLGAFLDPIADKLIVMACLIMLLPYGNIPAWMALVILSREIIITGLRSIASNEGIVIPASNLGKFKTIFQIVAIIGLLLHYDYHWFFGVNHPLLTVNMYHVGMFYFWIATVITIWSAVDYLRTFVRVFAK
jgi:CDP-diacylglycerol---glycerol-3-phosphate 3-phosphatidyltransferase